MRALLLFAFASAALSAQWVNHPTPGVPKTPNGAPNLTAPTPRAADGKPDLSGMWAAENMLPCDPAYGKCADRKIGRQTQDIGSLLPGGLPFQPWAAELVRKRTAAQKKEDPTAKCYFPGAPRAHAFWTYKKFVQTPGLLVVLDEFNANFRQIFTDGRSLPEDMLPTIDGYSAGHWEGDTMVVQSAGYTGEQWLDNHGSPITEEAKITERFHRVNYGTMEIEITVNDLKAYTKPWTVKVNQHIVLNTELIDKFCMENGKASVHMP